MEILSVSEMGKMLGISITTAYKLVGREDFPVLRVGNRKLIPRAALEKWVEANTGAKKAV